MNINPTSASALYSLYMANAHQSQSPIDIPIQTPSPDANTLPDTREIREFQESDSALARFISIKV